MKKILISGDSWSFAVYTHGTSLICLKEAFGDQLANRGYQIVNVSVAGSCNSTSVERLKRALADDNSFDSIIWVQTDPFRDLRTTEQMSAPIHGSVPKYNMTALQDLIISNNGSIIKAADAMLMRTYSLLDSAATLYKKDIYCIGGCVPLSDHISQFKNLKILIKSVPEFLIDGHTDSLAYDTEAWLTYQYVEYAKKNKIDLSETDWYTATDLFLNKTNAWGHCEEYFSPDKWHPNAAGHRLIADLIEKTLA